MKIPGQIWAVVVQRPKYRVVCRDDVPLYELGSDCILSVSSHGSTEDQAEKKTQNSEGSAEVRKAYLPQTRQTRYYQSQILDNYLKKWVYLQILGVIFNYVLQLLLGTEYLRSVTWYWIRQLWYWDNLSLTTEDQWMIKEKLSLCLSTRTWRRMGSGGIVPSFPNLGTRWTWMASVSTH